MKKIIILLMSLFLFVIGISCVAATDVNSDSGADELCSDFAGISESTPLSMVPSGRSPKLNDTIGCCHDAPLGMVPYGRSPKLNDTIGCCYNSLADE